jgi:hypothetical protein
MRRGVCPDCAGRIDTEVVDARDGPVPDSVPASFTTFSDCRQCLRFLSLPLTHAAVYHPASVAFYWDHGADILDTGIWEFHRHLREGRWTAERLAEGSDDFRAELRCEAASIRLSLDENAAVARAERVRRSGRSERGTRPKYFKSAIE